jgi:hypothetical protein
MQHKISEFEEGGKKEELMSFNNTKKEEPSKK